MKSLWNQDEAKAFESDLELRVYSSRLLGHDPSLVLHGGGNTSVKIREKNILGEEEEILYVKGSGWDLATIEAPGFTPIRLAHLVRLAGLPSLPDLQMVNELKTHQTRASAPTGSVEAILHAVLPHKYVDHTHADAVVTITNTADGEARMREIYGDEVVIVPYIMPGFDLARLVAEHIAAEATDRTIGMVLMNHGIFSFGETARESYERMIALVDRAEAYLRARGSWDIPPAPAAEITSEQRHVLAELRRNVSRAAGFPVLLSCHQQDSDLAFVRRDDLDRITQRGPATPDHVIRT
ncbi:MAG: class II aldolase/adducin family protein, partial [Pseudomonadota bacterium]